MTKAALTRNGVGSGNEKDPACPGGFRHDGGRCHQCFGDAGFRQIRRDLQGRRRQETHAPPLSLGLALSPSPLGEDQGLPLEALVA